MQISEIRVKLVENRSDRLKAFCSVTFDNMFVVRDLKIIEGAGGYFVAMPSRKLADRCRKCGAKNHLRSRFCNECGARLNDSRGAGQRVKLHADVAHPVNTQAREFIQTAVVEAYEKEIERSQQPDYVPTQLGDDYDEDDMDHFTATPTDGAMKNRDHASAGFTSSAERYKEPGSGKVEEPLRRTNFQDGIFESGRVDSENG